MATGTPGMLLTLNQPGKSIGETESPLERVNLAVSRKIYSPLPFGHIRIVTLHGGLWSDPIRCTLADVSVESKPVYDALSYVWGPQDDVQSILLNDEDFKITRNLYAALLNLRGFFDRVFWIDALCINQSDIEERNAQVKLMKTNFSSARLVVAWLGSASNDLELLIDHINEGEENGFGFKSKLADDSSLAEDFIKRLRVPLFDLLSREYWSRAWISQEVAASKSTTLFCGSRTFGFLDVLSFLGKIAEYINKNLQGNAEMLEVRKRCAFSGPHSLPLRVEKRGKGNVILWYSDKACRDPRDKVFALWGLLPQKMQEQIPVDYQMSLEDLFTVTTKAIIDYDQSLEVLCYPKVALFKGQTTFTPPKNLPSWVADLELGCFEMRTYAIGSIGLDDVQIFSADANLRRLWKRGKLPCHRFSLDGSSLFCSGICVGVVASVHQEDWPTVVHRRGSDQPVDQPEDEHHPPSTDDQNFIAASLRYLSRARNFLRLGSSENDIRFLCSVILGSEEHLDEDQLQWIMQLLKNHEKGISTLSSEEDVAKQAARLHVLLFMQLFAQRRHLYSYFPGTALENLPIPEQRCVGLGAMNIAPADMICILVGCSVPIILRKVEHRYMVIGDTYVHGIMEGQAAAGVRRDSDLIGEYCLR